MMNQLRKIYTAVILNFIKFCRYLFINTPLPKSRIVGKVRSALYKSTVNNSTVLIQYMGISLKAPSSDVGLVPGLLGGYYEKAELSYFKALCANSKCIIDVGANIGLYTCVAARSIDQDGRVYAFEPVEENLKMLKENVELNGVTDKVIVVRNAIGATNTSISINISDQSMGNHSIGIARGQGGRIEKVKQITLDTYCKTNMIKKIDIIKIDIEGYDYFALKGAKNILNGKNKPTVFIEFIPHLVKSCGIESEQFVKLVYRRFKHCFVFDEKHGTVEEVDQSKIDLFTSKISDRNLLLVDSEKHYKEINAMQK